MNANYVPISKPHLTQIEILGFDRIGFVAEVTRHSSDYGRIVSVKFEADGVKSEGKVGIELESADKLDNLLLRLKAITGLVRAKHII